MTKTMTKKDHDLTSKNWEPLLARVLVRRLEGDKQSPGGILLPDKAQKKPSKGVVLAIGPGRYQQDGSYVPVPVQVGDTVLFKTYGGYHANLDDAGDLIIVDEVELLAKLVGESKEGTHDPS